MGPKVLNSAQFQLSTDDFWPQCSLSLGHRHKIKLDDRATNQLPNFPEDETFTDHDLVKDTSEASLSAPEIALNSSDDGLKTNGIHSTSEDPIEACCDLNYDVSASKYSDSDSDRPKATWISVMQAIRKSSTLTATIDVSYHVILQKKKMKN